MTDRVIAQIANQEHFRAACWLEHQMREFAQSVGVKRAEIPFWTLGRRYECKFCHRRILRHEKRVHGPKCYKAHIKQLRGHW